MNVKQVFMAVTADEYELPVCVSDSCAEMARKLRIDRGAIYNSINHPDKHTGKHTGIKFLKVSIEGD